MSAGRIAVTGVGMVSALGDGAPVTFDRLVRGERAFGPISLFDTTGQRTGVAAEVRGFRVQDVVPKGAALDWSRSDALALVAAKEALASASVNPGAAGARLGIAVGITTGGMLEAEELLAGPMDSPPSAESAARFVSYPLSSTANRLAGVLGPAHRVATLCSACSSGANAIVQGAAWLRSGVTDVVLAGGADALCRLTVTGFNSLGATDTTPCRPFDRFRAGLTLGEGAGFLVLETEEAAVRRGARVLAWLSSFAVGAEAHHITQPEPSGLMPARLMRDAIAGAGLTPADVDYVNAHGTGTVSNDLAEAAGVHRAFGAHAERVLVSSSKGQIGHTLGAAGAIEAAVTVLALSRQEVPPTGGLTEADAGCRLNHVLSVGRPTLLRAALSNAFGFGGTGAVLLFERAEAVKRPDLPRPPPSVVITGVASIGPRGVFAGERCAEALCDAGAELPARISVRVLDLLDPARSRRFDLQASLAAAGAELALREANLSPQGVGIVAGTAFGSVERTVAFIRTAAEKGPRRAPPAEFPHMVPSAAAGNASIYLGLSGPAVATSNLEASAEAAVVLACDWLDIGLAEGIVAGSTEPHDALISGVLGPICESDNTTGRTEGAAWVVLETASAASARGARAYASIRRRYEFGVSSLAEARLEPPANAGRAIIVSARNPEPWALLLERSGWGTVSRGSVARAAGWHEGAGGFAVTAAAAAIAAGTVDEALVVGWNAARLYLFHLVRDP
jgi:3-oxoacyl-[acyl-carrier-protein] synthase II